ncbi:MAG: SPOR domain-containing protein [Marinobacter sp.]|uniref:SPOR domain-containing protein n=1 Tax=Marinobacter sp. TaxID=50741 RepID=UPI00299F34B2|nr:SPOR domain-containing protein [Marinobacter sp.]MDX1757238.1 SPOR domain-containing protein [Marinobacter sp.]
MNGPAEAPDRFVPIRPERFVSRAELSERSGFTAQYIAGYEEQTAIRFMEIHQDVPQLRYTRSRRSGRDWFVVFYGEFADRSEARSALQQLPDKLRREEPWIRTLADI